MDNSERCDYIKCIFKVSQLIADADTQSLNHIKPFIKYNAHSLLLKRFNIIKYTNGINKPICFIILFLAFTYVFISGGYVLQPGWHPPEDELRNMRLEDFTPENSYITKKNGTYTLYYNGKSYAIVENLSDFPNVPIR